MHVTKHQDEAGHREHSASPRGGGAVTVLLVASMALSMLQLYLVGTLGPVMVSRLHFPAVRLGWLTAAGFTVAAVLSPMAGRLVDRVGARRCLCLLASLTTAALGLLASSPSYWWLFAAIALGGAPQALANPATNRVILTVVDPAHRGGVTGLKQSGVLVGAFVAGLPLSAAAAVWGWRPVVGVTAVLAVAVAVAVWRYVPEDAPSAAGAAGRGVRRRAGASRTARWLAAYSVALGAGNGSVNTYLPLFGADRLGMPHTAASALVAVLAVVGIAGRVGWTRLARRPGLGVRLPALLTAGATASAVLLALSCTVGAWLAWPAAAGVGACAVAANAVSMLVIIDRVPAGEAGRDTALVSAGFFTGFVIGPPAFGALSQTAGYGPAWFLVTGEFAAATLLALAWRLGERTDTTVRLSCPGPGGLGTETGSVIGTQPRGPLVRPRPRPVTEPSAVAEAGKASSG